MVDAIGDPLDAGLHPLGTLIPLVDGQLAQFGQTAGQMASLAEHQDLFVRHSLLVLALGPRQARANHRTQPAAVGRFFQIAVTQGHGQDFFVVGQNATVGSQDHAANARQVVAILQRPGCFGSKGGSLGDLKMNRPRNHHRQKHNETHQA